MKTLDIHCKTVSDAIKIIKTYSIASHNWVLFPPSSSHINYSLFITFEHILNGEKVIINIFLPLFKKSIQLLMQNAVSQKKLIKIALTTRHKRLIKYMWHYLDEEMKNIMMAKILSAK